MNRVLRLIVLSLGLLPLVPGASLVAAPATDALPPGEKLDQVWAGHPVGFAILTERGHQFVAYYDAERRITVLGRKLGDRAWARIQPPGVPLPNRKRDSNVIGWDSHNTLRLALDRDGCLHLSGNMHVDPLVYYRTQKPFGVATLERVDRMTGEREKRCTYPVFFKNAAGDLMFRYRDGQSGSGSDLYNIYDTTTRTWRRLVSVPLLEGEGQRNGYALEPLLGPDGRFHLAWMWRDTPDCATNHTLSYARSTDFQTWENSRGEPITLPITLRTGDVVDAAKPGEGLINMTFNLGFDGQKRPLIAYHRYDAAGKSQAFIARPAATGGWEVKQLSQWDFRWAFSGGGSIAADVRLSAPRRERDGTLIVDYSTQAAGSGRWKVNETTLEVIERLPPLPSPIPAALRRKQSPTPGMEVQMTSSHSPGRRWVLRWETLGRNRDRPRESAPPPTELWLYEVTEPAPSAATPR